MCILRKTSFLLGFILIAFICREAFLATAFPPFTGQDEARHYNTVQWLASEHDASCVENRKDSDQDKEDLSTYRFSEEIRETSKTIGLEVWRDENYTKLAYIPGTRGLNESVLREHDWKKSTDICPPDIVSSARKFSLFHFIGNGIEKAFSGSDILVRFYLVRLLSVLLGTLTILLAYLVAVEASLSKRTSLLIAFIVSLQPNLSIYTTNINYDTLLIPCFTLFTWAGIRTLQRGLNIKNILLLAAAVIATVLTKGTGLVLTGGILFLVIYIIFTKRASWKYIPFWYWLIGALSITVAIGIANNLYHLSSLAPHLSFSSLSEYLGKSLPTLNGSSRDFWGTISWNEHDQSHWFVYGIWFTEALALVGLGRYFVSNLAPDFLPRKTIALFCLMIVISLQLGIRIKDWQVFQETGSLVLGTPGRYFLPTIVPQLILIAIGIGALVRKERLLERILGFLAVFMLAFYLYTLLLIIIPRFYL